MPATFLNRLTSERDELEASLDSLYSAVETRADAGEELEMNEAEQANAIELRNQIDTLNERIEVVRRDTERRAQYGSEQPTSRAQRATNTGTVTVTSPAVVRSEPAVYARSLMGHEDEPSFIADLVVRCGQQQGFRVPDRLVDDGFSDRLERHLRQTTAQYSLRDDSTGYPMPVFDRALSSTTTSSYSNSSDIGSLMPTDYRPDLYAPGLYGGRVTADLVARYPLPARGMTVSFPRVTTKASAGAQATQGTEVTSAGVATTETVLNIHTIASGLLISRQAIERGEMVEALVLDEIRMAVDKDLDAQVLNGSGSSGNAQGIIGVTRNDTKVTLDQARSGTSPNYTWTAVTIDKIWEGLVKGTGLVGEHREWAPDVIIMHPRRWAYLVASVDKQNRPLFQPTTTGRNLMGVGTMATGDVRMPAPVGTIAGISVVLDANMPTNLELGTLEPAANKQDCVIIMRRADQLLFEQPAPVMLRISEAAAANLQYELIAYTYFAFTSSRYVDSVSIVGGSAFQQLL